MSKLKDELLVHGYIRQQQLREIPIEIIELCLKWYHNPLFIEIFNSSRAQIMNDDKTIIRYFNKDDNENLVSSCYASLVMPSIDNTTIYEYTIKVFEESEFGVGLVNASFNKTDTWFYDGRHHGFDYLVFCSWGDIYALNQDHCNWDYDFKFDHVPLIIKMIYDASIRAVSFVIKEKDYGEVYKLSNGEGCSYRLAIYLKHGAMIELVGVNTKNGIESTR